MLEMFVTGDSINVSHLWSVKRHLSQGWTFVQQRWKVVRLLVILKLLTVVFQTAGYDVFSCVMAFGSSASAAEHFVAFHLKWNEQWCRYSWASLYWNKSQWSTKPHWFLLSFFLPVSVDDLCSHASYQCCGKVLPTWVNFLIPLKKVNLYKLLYCLYT